MLKLNDTSSGKHEIGNSVNSNMLEYASLKKFMMSYEEKGILIKFSQLKLFYERNSSLIAMQFVLQEKDKFSSTDASTFIYTDPKIFGPSDAFTTSKYIDEIVMSLSADEEIYLIKGAFEKNKIIRLGVYSTYGQFVEFGSPSVEYNFQWEYYFNLRYFDGFIIGWDENRINYLASLVYEKLNYNEDELNIPLKDTTYDIQMCNTEPIYQTQVYGTIDINTTIEDDLIKMNLMKQVKEGLVYLSEIDIYCDKSIDRIDTEYTNAITGDKVKSYHVGSEYSKERSKKSFLRIAKGDYVNCIKLSYNEYIESIFMRTFTGKTLLCEANEGEHRIEYEYKF